MTYHAINHPDLNGREDIRESGTYIRSEPDQRRDPLHTPEWWHTIPHVVPHDEASAYMGMSIR